MNNFLVIVIDGVGVGELPDSANYGDEGSNTLANMADVIGGLNLPTLEKLGLGNIIPVKGIKAVNKPLASFGKLAEKSKGKDSTTGHWELSGLYVDKDFDYYPNGFPEEMIKKFLELTGCKGILGNIAASGTEIIKELGDEHVQTGYPIVYTSADSVFQIAAHEEIIPLDELYRICKITRDEVLAAPLNVGRVIARPFIGETNNYKRTVNRKDFSLDPPQPTVLDLLQQNGIQTVAVGKINDLFNYKGISKRVITKTNKQTFEGVMTSLAEEKDSFIFVNFVDFDVYYGHRNDPQGFAKELEVFDSYLSQIILKMDDNDYLILTSDHGNDPTTPSTDHSREYTPLLLYNISMESKNLGVRSTFSDVGKTVAEHFHIKNDLKGISLI